MQQARLGRHVGKHAGAVVSQQRRSDRVFEPGTTRDENIQMAVVVVIGLNAEQSTQLLTEIRGGCTVFKGAVARVVKEGHRLGEVGE